MKSIDLEKVKLHGAKKVREGVWLFDKSGGKMEIIEPEDLRYRYLVGFAEVKAGHSVAMELNFFRENEENYRIGLRFGMYPELRTLLCLDLTLIDSRTIFTERTPGTLKLVAHGNRTEKEEVARIEFGLKECFEDVEIALSDFYLTDEKPKEFPIPEKKLIDQFGQWTGKDWPGKVKSEEELRAGLFSRLDRANWEALPGKTRWGGEADRRLAEGAGFFRTKKTADGRWHLVDPDGFEFFSIGSDCVNPGDAARVDSLEALCEFPPEPWLDKASRAGLRHRGPYRFVNYTAANLMRVFGDEWQEKWREIAENVLIGSGMNTVANWSAEVFREGEKRIPYVYQTGSFPATKTAVFRDFPDVLADEYRENAKEFAKSLLPLKDDPWQIGYFLRNEPEFAFVPNLLIADEALRNPADTATKRGVLARLRAKYGEIAPLNEVWGSAYASFEEIGRGGVIEKYPDARADLSEISKFLVSEYVRIPSEACRAADPNHLNLGMRWAVADSPEQMAGWENFDVFSINNYSFSPLKLIDYVASQGVDLPVMIGEFHFGSLDAGLPATGLKGVLTQADRAKAFRHYIESCASHPNAVGAHWFQFSDQSALGRFDGENYQIGLVDVCVRPYDELAEACRASARVVAEVKNGERAPFDEPFREIPMIGY
ncbi:MAG: hypothetical protein IKX85_02065 [Clostridia bacterium]|nr:hypothetical protein [Clostridia bacterium]